MTVEIPTTEPLKVTAGDTLTWRRNDFSNYLPADGWALSYVLINAEGKITINAATSGTGYLITVAAAISADYTAGLYKWQAYVTNSGTGERVNVGKGSIEVLPNFSAAATYESRSVVKQTLDAIEAVILGRASQDQESYAIMGRQLKRTPIEELLKLRDKYKSLYAAEIRAENSANGKNGKNSIAVRF